MQHIEFTLNGHFDNRADVKVKIVINSHLMSTSKECVDDVVGQIVELNALN
jgi:hypothetical protein